MIYGVDLLLTLFTNKLLSVNVPRWKTTLGAKEDFWLPHWHQRDNSLCPCDYVCIFLLYLPFLTFFVFLSLGTRYFLTLLTTDKRTDDFHSPFVSTSLVASKKQTNKQTNHTLQTTISCKAVSISIYYQPSFPHLQKLTHRWREDEEDDQRAEKTKEQSVDFESRDGQGRSTTTQILRDFGR